MCSKKLVEAKHFLNRINYLNSKLQNISINNKKFSFCPVSPLKISKKSNVCFFSSSEWKQLYFNFLVERLESYENSNCLISVKC